MPKSVEEKVDETEAEEESPRKLQAENQTKLREAEVGTEEKEASRKIRRRKRRTSFKHTKEVVVVVESRSGEGLVLQSGIRICEKEKAKFQEKESGEK